MSSTSLNIANLTTKTGEDASDALQAAIDQLGALGVPGTVRIPADSVPWRLSRPVVVDHPNITIAGEGLGSLIESDMIGPAFLVGVKRSGTPRPGIDLHGLDDGTIARRPGMAYARNLSGSCLVASTSPFALGGIAAGGNPSRYRDGSPLTIEILAVAPEGGWRTSAFLFGSVGRFTGLAEPFYLCCDGYGQLEFRFQVEGGGESVVRVPFAPSARVLRLVIQLHFDTGAIVVAIDNQIVAPDLSGLDHSWKPGAKLVYPWTSEFEVGRTSSQRFTRAQADWSLAGLCFSVGRYQPGKPGDSLQRRDGIKVDDQSRFVAWDGSVIAMLRPDNTASPSDRLIPYCSAYGDSWPGYAVLIDRSWSTADWVANSTIRDLSISSLWHYGSLVTYGCSLYPKFRRLSLAGAARGIDQLNGPTSYTGIIDECTFRYQSDTVVKLDVGITRVTDCRFEAWPLQTIRAIQTSLSVADCFVAGVGGAVNVFRLHNSALLCERVQADFEQTDNPTDAGIYLDATEFLGTNSHVIRDTQLGCGVPNRPYLKLDSTAIGGIPWEGSPRGTVVVENSFTGQDRSYTGPVVAADSALWDIRWKGDLPQHGTPIGNWLDPNLPVRGTVESGSPMPVISRPPGRPAVSVPTLLDLGAESVKAPSLPLAAWDDARGKGPRVEARGGGLCCQPSVFGSRGGVRFDGRSYFAAPGVRGTSGSLTAFAVVKPNGTFALFQVNPGRIGGIRVMGSTAALALVYPVWVPVVSRSEQPVCLAIRLDAGRRLLESWCNLRKLGGATVPDSFVLDWSGGLLVGSENNGEVNLDGWLGAFQLHDGAASDAEVDAVSRDLMDRYGVPF